MITRSLFTAGLIACITSGALAQQLTVRSGEHGTFSRLVIPFPQGTSWEVNQTEGGISLIPGGSTFRYDLREVFRLIPKARISDVRAEVGSPGLFIETSGAVHSKSFQLANGAVVLDVIDGAPAYTFEHESSRSENITRRYDTPHFDLFWKNNSSQKSVGSGAGEREVGINLPTPDARVSEAERRVFENFSRATAQGIFNVDLLRGNRAAHTADVMQKNMPVDATDGSELAVESRTVIDRDLGLIQGEPRILLTGQRCLPDSFFDLSAWLGDGSAFEQISAARSALVEEFDAPNESAALNLVRVYLGLGFGAEARSILRSFELTNSTAQVYTYISEILDHGVPPQESTINKMASCNGKIALWAFMGRSQPTTINEVDLGAVQASFSSLPSNIRSVLGPDLVDKLLSIDARDTAYAIRNAIDRAPDSRGSSLAITQASLDMAAGDPISAEQRLQHIANSNDSAAARALTQSINARLERDRPVDQDSIESAAAFIHELGNSPEGLILKRAMVLGQGSTGAFDTAFSTLNRWPDGEQIELRDKTRQELYTMIAKVPDDEMFINQMIKRHVDVNSARLPSSLQNLISARLAGSGFARAAKEIIDDESKRAPEGRLALARAALMEPDPAAAISHLEGLDGEIASTLRAEALARLGEHAAAAQIFSANNNSADTAIEAWRAGDWELVKEYGSNIQKQAVSILGEMQPQSESSPSSGLLNRSNELLKRSKLERATIEALLALEDQER